MPFRFLQVLFWLAAGCCVIAHVAIVRSVVRGRRDQGWAADATFAAIPAVGLLLILVWTWHVLHQVRPA